MGRNSAPLIYAATFLDGENFNAVTLGLAVVALVGTGIGTYYARRAVLPPRRKLVISVPESTSLLAISGSQIGITVTLADGTPIPNAHLTGVAIENAGLHPVETGHFDSARPIKLGLGAPILGIVVSPTTPASFAKVDPASNKHVLLGPELIQRGQRFFLQVLTDGEPKIEQPAAFIVGTSVVLQSDHYSSYSIIRAVWRETGEMLSPLIFPVIVAVIVGALATFIIAALRG